MGARSRLYVSPSGLTDVCSHPKGPRGTARGTICTACTNLTYSDTIRWCPLLLNRSAGRCGRWRMAAPWEAPGQAYLSNGTAGTSGSGTHLQGAPPPARIRTVLLLRHALKVVWGLAVLLASLSVKLIKQFRPGPFPETGFN